MEMPVQGNKPKICYCPCTNVPSHRLYYFDLAGSCNVITNRNIGNWFHWQLMLDPLAFLGVSKKVWSVYWYVLHSPNFAILFSSGINKNTSSSARQVDGEKFMARKQHKTWATPSRFFELEAEPLSRRAAISFITLSWCRLPRIPGYLAWTSIRVPWKPHGPFPIS